MLRHSSDCLDIYKPPACLHLMKPVGEIYFGSERDYAEENIIKSFPLTLPMRLYNIVEI